MDRLDAIGCSLAESAHGLALIGLGSVGQELDRLDEYSDLDFFAIVETGYKNSYIDDLSWLGRIAPLAYVFRNTADGYKVLYEDGVLCEFAVFTPEELAVATFAPGRLVWSREDFDTALSTPRQKSSPPQAPDVDHLLGEALTNLYVGLGRFHRGEKLSALRFVQGYAVDRFIELSELIDNGGSGHRDAFDGPRRYEQRHPRLAAELPNLLQGYERTPESAAALLAILDKHFAVDPAIKSAIMSLVRRDEPTQV